MTAASGWSLQEESRDSEVLICVRNHQGSKQAWAEGKIGLCSSH